MTKATTKQAPATPPPVNGSGLTAEAEAALSSALADLKVYDDRQHLLGAREREQVQSCERKLVARLSPQPVEQLLAEASWLLKRYAPTLDAGREAVHQREAELAEESA